MALAIGLGCVAVFLVVVGHTQKQLQIGLLVGLWGALLGAFAAFGPRRSEVENDEALGQLGRLDQGDRALVLRREHDQQFAVTVRREMERSLREELSQLRDEVAGLRTDIAEKVNTQLRLERIETTRVTSSDIEELQREVRRLSVSNRPGQQAIDTPARAPTTVVATEVRTSAPMPYALAGSTVPSAPERPAPHPPAPSFPPADHATSLLPRAQTPSPRRPPEVPADSSRMSQRRVEPPDPLQALPRLSQFEYDWGSPPERGASPSVWEANHVEPSSQRQARPGPESYVGRRRSSADAVSPALNGPHDPSPNDMNGRNGYGSTPGNRSDIGGRRHRADDEVDNVLGRLLDR